LKQSLHRVLTVPITHRKNSVELGARPLPALSEGGAQHASDRDPGPPGEGSLRELVRRARIMQPVEPHRVFLEDVAYDLGHVFFGGWGGAPTWSDGQRSPPRALSQSV